jgi:hypothetical protein
VTRLSIVLLLSLSAPAFACSVFDDPTDNACAQGLKSVWGIALGGALLTNMVYSVRMARFDMTGEYPSRNDGIGELISVVASGTVGLVTVSQTIGPVYYNNVPDRAFAIGMMAAGAACGLWSMLLSIHATRVIKRPPELDFGHGIGFTRADSFALHF